MTPKLLRHMPNLSALARTGWQAELGTVLPAVTCSVQSTFLTGAMPRDHGIVGNGWYFRDVGEVHLWRQHNKLVAGREAVGDRAAAQPGLPGRERVLVVRDGRDDRHHRDAAADLPRRRPQVPGRVRAPAGAARRAGRRAGRVPAVPVLGPDRDDPASSEWIIGASRKVLADHHPDLLLAYVPHLDYDLQRFGPDSPQAVRAAREVDPALQPLLDDARNAGATVVALSEYGITDVRRPVDINRLLRREGLLEVYTQDGMEYLDPWVSRAFAVADHQVAHVYVADPADIPAGAGHAGRAVRGGRGAGPGRAGEVRHRPRAGRRAGRGGRAGRLVHLLLLARRRPRAGLRAGRGDPPQARLRPRGAVLRPGRPARRRRRRG